MDKSQVSHDLAVAYVERCLQIEGFCSDDAVLNKNAQNYVFSQMLDAYKTAESYFSTKLA